MCGGEGVVRMERVHTELLAPFLEYVCYYAMAAFFRDRKIVPRKPNSELFGGTE